MNVSIIDDGFMGKYDDTHFSLEGKERVTGKIRSSERERKGKNYYLLTARLSRFKKYNYE